MKKNISLTQKRADTDVSIILLSSLAVFIIYILFQQQMNRYAFGEGPLLLRTILMAFLQFGLAGLGMTIVCIFRKESFVLHGLHTKKLLPAIGLSFLCFVPHLIFMIANGDWKGYMPFQGVKLTSEVLASNFPINILGMIAIITAWGFFEGFNYAVLANKINQRYPIKHILLNWGAIACAVFCILIHGAIGLTPAGIIEMITVFVLIYGMLVVKEQTGNAWGCVFVFLFLWNAF